MASLIKRGGKWSVKYRNHTGKQVMTVGYSDKRETEALGRRLEDEARAIKIGDVDPQVEARRLERSRPMSEHVVAYRASLEAASRESRYVDHTIYDIQKFIHHARIVSASSITRPMMDSWVNELKLTYANKTVNRRIGSVQQFLKWLQSIGGVVEYVLKKYPKLPTGDVHRRRIRRALSPVEADKLMSDTRKCERRDLYTFALKSGLRLKECRGMTVNCINLTARVIRIPAHVAKSKREQTVPIHPLLIEMLTRLTADQSPDTVLFQGVPTHKCVVRNLRLDCKRLSIPVAGVSFHSLRHTFCTNLARANVHPAILQKLARHSDLKTTLNYYVHLTRDDESAAIAKC